MASDIPVVAWTVIGLVVAVSPHSGLTGGEIFLVVTVCLATGHLYKIEGLIEDGGMPSGRENR